MKPLPTLKPLATFLFSLLPGLLLAAEQGKLTLAVRDIPADATEVVAVIDVVAPPPPAYEEPVAAVAPPPAVAAPAAAPAANAPVAALVDAAAKAGQPAPKADPQAAGRRRGRRGMNGPPPFAAVRRAVETKGATTATLEVPVPAGDNYQVRVVALRGGGTFPLVIAGHRMGGVKVAAGADAPVALSLKAPRLTPDAANPTIVAPGAHYTLAGTLSDPSHSLGAKNRMRVWLSAGTPPRENFSGAQVSTVEVTTEGDDVKFTFALTAPAEPTTLYFQFGELPGDFARTDGTQAAFVVSPNFAAKEAPLSLRVAPVKTASSP